MNILYIHQYFKTPQEAGGTRSYWNSLALIEKGHTVIMITGDSTGKQKKIIRRIVIDNINVIYVKNAYRNDMGLLARAFSFFMFMIISTLVAIFEKTIDFVIATSTPLTIGFPALILKVIKRKKFIFEVRDLWPEVPIQMGGLKNKFLQNISLWFAKIIYKNAEHIIALSPNMKEGITKYGISPEQISLIPNMSKIDEFFSRKPNIKIANQFNIHNQAFKAVYFGAMGIANGLEYILDAAKILKDRDENKIEILFLGNGRLESDLISKCERLELNNCKFLGSHPMKIVSEIVNLCDCSIVSFVDIPILKINSPNKFFDSLSAGKPIIVNSDGWTKEIVEKNFCGIFVSPSYPEELADLLVKWKNNTKLVKILGRNGRKLAEEKFDKSILTNTFVQTIEKYSRNYN